MSQEDIIFVVPVFDQWLLHAPLHGVTTLLNEAIIARLKDNLHSKNIENLSPRLKFISKHPSEAPRIRKGAPDPIFFGIIPTRACNMSCRYCAFGASEAGSEVMEHGLAIAAVDWMASHVKKNGKKNLKIHFFGGEPFVAPEVVDAAIHRARWWTEKENIPSTIEVSK